MQERIWDAAGLGISGLCVVHCLALPVAAVSLPALGVIADAEWVHWSLLAVAAPAAGFALWPRQHEGPKRRLAIAAAGVGLLLMLSGALEFPSHEWGEALTLSGVVALGLAHLLNWRDRHVKRVNADCCCDGHEHGTTRLSSVVTAPLAD